MVFTCNLMVVLPLPLLPNMTYVVCREMQLITPSEQMVSMSKGTRYMIQATGFDRQCQEEHPPPRAEILRDPSARTETARTRRMRRFSSVRYHFMYPQADSLHTGFPASGDLQIHPEASFRLSCQQRDSWPSQIASEGLAKACWPLLLWMPNSPVPAQRPTGLHTLKRFQG